MENNPDITDLIKARSDRYKTPAGEEFSSIKEKELIDLGRTSGRPLADLMIEALKLDIWPQRYRAQRGTVSAAEQIRILGSIAAIIGAGGLGGSVCLLLARMGVGTLIVCDGDRFDESNLNRQALSDVNRLGMNKAECASMTIRRINPAVRVVTFPVWADDGNLPKIMEPAGVVVDCLDNLATRLLVLKHARTLGIPFVHGALAGDEGMVMTIFPEDPGLEALYGDIPPDKASSGEAVSGTPTITPALTACFQAAEASRVLMGRPPLARNRLVHLDLSTFSLETLQIG